MDASIDSIRSRRLSSKQDVQLPSNSFSRPNRRTPTGADRPRDLVVGGGMTSLHFVEALADRSARPIAIFGDELYPPYDRVHLGSVLAGKSPTDLALRDESWFRAQGIELHLKNRIESIDVEHRLVETASGETLEYDRLVLATGGRAFCPPIPGRHLDRVVTYRTIEDAETIARIAGRARSVVVAGGGLLGLEAARAIQDFGCRVEIVEMAPRLLPRQLDRRGAEVLETQIRMLGIKLRLLCRVEEIFEPGGAQDPLEIRLTDGSVIESDLVVFAAGIRPNDELARNAGLECHREGGIEVDDGMATSDPNIFAIGECVRHRGQLYGFVAPCYEMAEILADRLTGGTRTFIRATPSARLKIDEIDVAAVGDSLADGPGLRELSWHQQDEYRRIVLQDNRIIGAIAVGAGSDFPRLQESVANRARVRPWQERRFNRSGRLWPAGQDTNIAQWPDSAVLCTCTGVTCGALRSLRENGCRTRAALSEKSGAGTVCGNCGPLLSQLSGETPAAVRSGAGWTLGLTAFAGLGLLGAAAIYGPIPFSTTVLRTPEFDFLWRDAWWKQLSGFVLLGLCALSLVLSLRKRWPRFQLGRFAQWRLLHSVLGVGTIVAAAVHSGFRLGENLNFVLMSSFLGVVLLGSGSGLITALEHRLPGRAGASLRRGMTGLHVFLFWPIPLLVLFHVLSVYFY